MVKEFCWAAATGDLEALRNSLRQNRELIDQRDDYAPALHWAVLRGQKKIVIYLLERGADPNLTSSEKLTALDIARREAQNAASEEIGRVYLELGDLLRAYGGITSKPKSPK